MKRVLRLSEFHPRIFKIGHWVVVTGRLMQVTEIDESRDRLVVED